MLPLPDVRPGFACQLVLNGQDPDGDCEICNVVGGCRAVSMGYQDPGGGVFACVDTNSVCPDVILCRVGVCIDGECDSNFDRTINTETCCDCDCDVCDETFRTIWSDDSFCTETGESGVANFGGGSCQYFDEDDLCTLCSDRSCSALCDSTECVDRECCNGVDETICGSECCVDPTPNCCTDRCVTGNECCENHQCNDGYVCTDSICPDGICPNTLIPNGGDVIHAEGSLPTTASLAASEVVGSPNCAPATCQSSAATCGRHDAGGSGILDS